MEKLGYVTAYLSLLCDRLSTFSTFDFPQSALVYVLEVYLYIGSNSSFIDIVTEVIVVLKWSRTMELQSVSEGDNTGKEKM